MMKKKQFTAFLTAIVLAVSGLSVQGFSVIAEEESPVPFAVEDAVYEQLMKYHYFYDENGDDIITEKEMSNCIQLMMNLEGVTDLSWVTKLTNVSYISFEGGALTDFSILKELPNLQVLELTDVPITDISFLKGMHMESVRLSGTDQITLEQRLEILEWNDCTVEKGFSEIVGATPVGMFEDSMVILRIADEEIAEFTNRRYGAFGEIQEVYGKNVGTTVYEMLIDDEVVLSGEITVTEQNVFDPPLREEKIGDPEILDSFYYGTYNVVLRNGTLYGIKGAQVYTAEENVKDYDRIYMKDEVGYYQYADLVLLEDDTLLVNGETITETKFTEIENGCVITQNNEIYAVYPLNEKFQTVKIGSDFKEFPYDTDYYYISQSGEVIYFKVDYNAKKLVVNTQKTGIMNPISCDYNLFVDEDNVLWKCKTYPSFSKSKGAEDVVSVGYSDMTGGGAGYVYTTSDGTIYSIASGKPVTLVEPQQWQSYLDGGSFYIHDYMEELQNENDCLVDYFIMDDHTLTLSFVDTHFAITNVAATICAEYDEASQQGYIYFLRTDGSIWRYALETQECIDLDADKSEPIDPEPNDPVPGDVNGDSQFNVADVIALQRWLLNDGTEITNAAAADLNNDSILDAFDLCMMKRALLSNDDQNV